MPNTSIFDYIEQLAEKVSSIRWMSKRQVGPSDGGHDVQPQAKETYVLASSLDQSRNHKWAGGYEHLSNATEGLESLP